MDLCTFFWAESTQRLIPVIASLVFQAFGVPEEAIESMLTAIEEMKYFLRTAYGPNVTLEN